MRSLLLHALWQVSVIEEDPTQAVARYTFAEQSGETASIAQVHHPGHAHWQLHGAARRVCLRLVPSAAQQRQAMA